MSRHRLVQGDFLGLSPKLGFVAVRMFRMGFDVDQVQFGQGVLVADISKGQVVGLGGEGLEVLLDVPFCIGICVEGGGGVVGGDDGLRSMAARPGHGLGDGARSPEPDLGIQSLPQRFGQMRAKAQKIHRRPSEGLGKGEGLGICVELNQQDTLQRRDVFKFDDELFKPQAGAVFGAQEQGQVAASQLQPTY